MAVGFYLFFILMFFGSVFFFKIVAILFRVTRDGTWEFIDKYDTTSAAHIEKMIGGNK